MQQAGPYTLAHFNSEAWELMLESIGNAKRSIDLEHFILIPGDIGDRFIDALCTKAKEGVKVRVLLDYVGSFKFDENAVQKFKNAGIHLRFFNSIIPLSLTHHTPLFYRDHQKLIVIDGEVGLTGGTCIEERMRSWRDTTLRVDNSAIAQGMQAAFDYLWDRAVKKRGIYPTPNLARDTEYLCDVPFSRKRPMYRQLRNRLKTATKRAMLATPYFVPPHRLLRRIKATARRGVEVILLISQYSDAPFAGYAAQWHFDDLLSAGVRIVRYDEAIYHAKLALIDDWVMVGSHNMDHLSLQYNFEGGISSTDPNLVRLVREQLTIDIERSREVNLQEWRKRGFIERLFELLVLPISFIS